MQNTQPKKSIVPTNLIPQHLLASMSNSSSIQPQPSEHNNGGSSIGKRLYWSVLSLFILFAVFFIVFQQAREKEYKQEIIDTQLQSFNQALHNELVRLVSEGHTAAVIESSSFTGQAPLVALADYIVVVTAPEELRVARAVAAGWNEADVRARMARQLTDEQRLRFATVSFVNDGTPEQLYDQVVSWWNAEKEQL